MENKPFPLSALDSLADGQPIACIKGVLTKLYPPKNGESSYGKWQIQNGEITADGVVIPIAFKDRDVVDTRLKGRTIILTAATEKTMSGIYYWIDTKDGATVRKIKVTASASLDIMDEDAPAKPQQSQQKQEPARTQNHQNSSRSEKTKDQQEFSDAKKVINQIANLHLLCALAVERYEAPAFKKLTGHEMSDTQRQAAVASIFIKAEREQLVRSMPVCDASEDPRFVQK